MEMFELEREVIYFCSLKKEERYTEIKKSIYTDKRILDVLKELAECETEPHERQNFLDHIELFKEFYTNGIKALSLFNSISEIELTFVRLAFGFKTIPDRKPFLLSNPFLIDKRSIDIITKYIEREKYLKENPASRLYRNLLKACWVLGIDRAFVEFEVPEEKYLNVINSLIMRETYLELVGFVATYQKEISSNKMRNVFHYLQAFHEKDGFKRERLVSIWDDLILGYQSDKSEIWFWE